MAGGTDRDVFSRGARALEFYLVQFSQPAALPGARGHRHYRTQPAVLFRRTPPVGRYPGDYHLDGTAVHLRHRVVATL